jgi:hypothetical protein
VRKLAVLLVTILLILVTTLVTAGCQEQPDSSSNSPEKGNPKLDSQLNRLGLAETHGEAALFAEQNNIELINGSVRVIIECVPGWYEDAAEATNAVGIIEAKYDALLQAVVPVKSLFDLADQESIRFIRLPQEPVAASN